MQNRERVLVFLWAFRCPILFLLCSVLACPRDPKHQASYFMEIQPSCLSVIVPQQYLHFKDVHKALAG